MPQKSIVAMEDLQDWQIDYIALQLSSRPANTGSYLLIELELFETELRNILLMED